MFLKDVIVVQLLKYVEVKSMSTLTPKTKVTDGRSTVSRIFCKMIYILLLVVVFQSLSQVWFFPTPWTTCITLGAPVLHCSLTVCSNSCSLSWWCYPTISSSGAPFSFCLRSFLASGSFPLNWLFASGGQSIGASSSVLPMNIQDWFPLGLTGLISLLSKGFSRVFSNTTVQKHQFLSAQPSL